MAMTAWFVFLLGCEKQPGTKEQQTAPVIVSRAIVSPLPAETKPILLTDQKPEQSPDQKSAQLTGQPAGADHPAEEINQIPAGSVPEELAKREEAAAVTQPGYDPKGRVDPFVSLIQTKEEKSETPLTLEEKPERMLTPLEKLELDQIRLVAVVLMKNRKLAMVEEATGKGYEVKIGTYMGKNSGQVSEIHPNSIIVKDYVKDFKGNRLERLQEIKLHKKEDGE